MSETPNALSIIPDDPSAPLTAARVKTNVDLVRDVMRRVMTDGIHYGVVPNCGDRKVLKKPGAELLAMTFQIAVDPQIEDLSTGDEIRYRIRAAGVLPNGRLVGCGVGEASTSEEKYRWRDCKSAGEWDATAEDRRRIKYGDRDRRQIRTNPADLANTVLKMAKKRALVDLILTATAASDTFTQDLDDDEIPPGAAEPAATPAPVQRPSRKGGGKSAPDSTPEQTRELVDSETPLSPDDATLLADGQRAIVAGELAFEPSQYKTAAEKPYYRFKLRGQYQPVEFSAWGEIPDGLIRGSRVRFGVEISSKAGRVYRNADHLEIL